jgi:hypothetical protein
MEYTAKRISVWFQNALEKNFNEWLSKVTPFTIEGNFESSMPNDINTMLIQQVMRFYLQLFLFQIFRVLISNRFLSIA